ncbi:MAG: efflux RND transporter permease subunit [Planctomycetales bacterium]
MTPPHLSLLTRFVNGLIRFRLPLFWGAIGVTLLAIYPATQLTFDQSIETLYAPDDPHLLDYLESKRLFGGDELVGVAYQDEDLLALAGLERVRDLAARLSKIPGVRASSTQDLANGLDLTLGVRLSFMKKRHAEIMRFFRGILVGEDERTTAVVLRLESEDQTLLPAGKSFATFRTETIAAIRAVALEHTERTGLAVSVVGEPVQVHDMFHYVQQDGAVLGWASLVLLVVVILVIFKNLRWVLLPIIVVQVTLLWTKALLVVSGIQLTMVSSILESLVTIIGVATVMHLSLVYCEARRELDRAAALAHTLAQLATDVFWVSATTAAGFAAQLSSHVYPVKSFGIMMTLGSMLIVVAIAVLLPGGVLLGRFASDPDVSTGENSRLGRALARMCHWVERHPWRVLGICLAVTAVALCGTFRIRLETDFSRNFRESSPIVQALNFVEDNLGGAGTWEVNFPAPETLDDAFLDRIRDLANRLRALEVSANGQSTRLTKVLAISDGIDLVPRIPFLVRDLHKQLELLALFQPEFVSSLYNPQEQRMRISLRARERLPADLKQRLIEGVERMVEEEFPVPEPKDRPRATGLFVLLTFLIDSLLGDQWTSFGWGAVGIITMMALAYRSLRIGLISLFPNLLPIVLVVGTMGWLDLPINIATAMISAVSMGLTVDASIFYISAFRRFRRQGMDFSAALRATQHDVGRALVYSNIALILGFLVLTLSHFVPLIYFGLLVSVAMVGGLAGNLVLLPLLLRFERTA